MASSIYLSMVNKPLKDEISIEESTRVLLLDTYGMVKIIEKLKEF